MAKVVFKDATRTYEFSKEEIQKALSLMGRITNITINGAFVFITSIESEHLE